MSKDKKRNPQPTLVEVMPASDAPADVVPELSVVPPPVQVPVQNPRLSDIDKMALDLAKERRLTALADSKTAMAKNENAELAFKYVVLQIYMKYSLTDQDAISEAGEIIKGGAVQRPQGQ